MRVLILLTVLVLAGCSIKRVDFEANINKADFATDMLQKLPQFAYCFDLSYGEAREDLSVFFRQARETSTPPPPGEYIGFSYALNWGVEVVTEVNALFLEKHRKTFMKGKKTDDCIETFSDKLSISILSKTD